MGLKKYHSVYALKWLSLVWCIFQVDTKKTDYVNNSKSSICPLKTQFIECKNNIYLQQQKFSFSVYMLQMYMFYKKIYMCYYYGLDNVVDMQNICYDFIPWQMMW